MVSHKYGGFKSQRNFFFVTLVVHDLHVDINSRYRLTIFLSVHVYVNV